MRHDNDLLHKGCAAPAKWYVYVAGGIVIIALCVLGAISVTMVG